MITTRTRFSMTCNNNQLFNLKLNCRRLTTDIKNNPIIFCINTEVINLIFCQCLTFLIIVQGMEYPYSSAYSASDPAARWGGASNMKSMWLTLAAIFVITYLYRAVGSMAPLPPGSATAITDTCAPFKSPSKHLLLYIYYEPQQIIITMD